MTALEQDERFEAALDDCCRRVLQGEDLERCLADQPADYREDLARLVPVATRMGGMARDPSPAFEAQLEQRLLAAVDQARQSQRRGFFSWLGRAFPSSMVLRAAVTAVAVVIVLSLGGFGLVNASANSLPDSPLYQVKTAQAWLEQVLARDAQSKLAVAQRQLVQRGRDLQQAVQSQKDPSVTITLAEEVAALTRQSVTQALALDSAGRPQAEQRVLAEIQTMEQQIDQGISSAPIGDRPVLRRLRAALDVQAQRLTTSDTSTPGQDTPEV